VKSTLAILSLATVFGCKSNSFNAGGKQGIRPATATLQLPCGAGGQGVQTPVFQGVSGTMVRVSGELCSVVETQVSNATLSISLVVDFSGSMSDNDPSNGGSCGRLQAASAIVNKMLQSAKGKGNIQIGVVQFADDARVALPLTDIQSFSQHLNPTMFCGATTATNHAAGIQSAQQLLTGAQGDKIVYFITDGEPTRPLNPALQTLAEQVRNFYNVGVEAANALRTALPGVQFNLIRLDLKKPEIDARSYGIDPEQYLKQLVGGDPNRVRIAGNAAELAAQIVTFEAPKVQSGTFDSKGIVAELTAGQFGSKKVAVESVVPVQGREGVWVFTTVPIELFGAVGQRVENRLSLKSVTQPIPETAGTIIFELQ
jgi:uncharacterized protein YegL